MDNEGMKLNKVATARNVRHFLVEDFQLYLNRAGLRRIDLSSPQLDDTGVTTHNNSAEKKMLKIFDYQHKCIAVYQAICNCTDSEEQHIYHRTVLLDRYIKLLEDWKIYTKIGLSASRYRQVKQDALCEFAECLPVSAAKKGTEIRELRAFDDPDIPDQGLKKMIRKTAEAVKPERTKH